ncbi:MAG: hypothetical protein A3H72_02065 [Candidatus Doudnabacteria bacterium RIFCSPLOWO2_02_FULL_48_8]|uniref:Uncharacterized protein n=1 Tax=Candidatus Doudnabacteria bacterium RIFCSPHIGHO2_01_FULL_46_24 TaxID=1817825 RepID=A0A1F5NSS5_9BACT|nr:MAG: hypothetical protein A2720_04200 [Candidatus Doudnabacteria bacterium RIFCSPHIGHO2_01_FULL_46_24]OGE94149.1 MAG: hypothetical protein A3E98_02750 [Candidatus Doudnabacteria bacterium RIFCSPHIGHO2_12_FULL_48_11]OGE95590.1 MAG: hypothetical protein A3H72_02065 [Candidatus Doudnabacteria bacterium RIFCSPLOWO2_02_FULL_48_8]
MKYTEDEAAILKLAKTSPLDWWKNDPEAFQLAVETISILIREGRYDLRQRGSRLLAEKSGQLMDMCLRFEMRRKISTSC